MPDGDPREWREGSDAAYAALGNVVDQVSELILDREKIGSEAALAGQLRELVLAKETNDLMVLRQAAMEVAVAAAQWCAALDLRGRR